MGKNLTALAMRIAPLACLTSALGLAESWSGVLVDSRCWESEEGNVTRKDSSNYVNRDRNLEILMCSPKGKTKSFAIVLLDGLSFKLDAAGNAKAAELVQKIGKKSPVHVAVTGETNKNTITVESISMAR